MDVFSRAARAIQQADLLIIGGTSLVVYPAASLINYFSGSNLCRYQQVQHSSR